MGMNVFLGFKVDSCQLITLFFSSSSGLGGVFWFLVLGFFFQAGGVGAGVVCFPCRLP